MSENGSVRNTTLAPALGSPGTLGPTARVALWMPVGRGNVKFSMMGRKRGRFFYFGSLFRTLVWAWHDRVNGGTVLQASCLTACQFGISVSKTVLVFWLQHRRPATVCGE